jgi:molybdopterin molybdotransferase
VAPQDMPLGAIYNSNRFMLHGLLKAAGCEVSDLGIVPDRLDATRETLRRAAQAHDLIISSGGMSVGEEDHVRPALQAEGRVDLWQLSIKPGKPLAFGAVRRDSNAQALFIGLPGNPVSSFVTFLLVGMPVVQTLQGRPTTPTPFVPTTVGFDWLKPDMRRREFLRVRRGADGRLECFQNQSSGVLTSAVWGDGLLDVAAGQVIRAGDRVPYAPWSAWGLVT